MDTHDLSLSSLRRAYLAGGLQPARLITDILRRCEDFADYNIWITRLSESALQTYLDRLQQLDPHTHPLWGIPFAVKDNIDLAGVDITAACEAFRRQAQESARVVQKLIDAGAVPLGKTNLDQFATGLVGTRSPFGACRNAFNPEYISGGSSSGSALSVALGLVSFSLGTDTAGSGRVPAGFNNLLGVKPTRGLLSAKGMLPACRSLDCMSIFALNSDDAAAVLAVAEGFDPQDAYSRTNPFDNSSRHYGYWSDSLRLGVLGAAHLKFFGDEAYAAAYEQALQDLREMGAELVEIDYSPFIEAAELLYQGPWVAERYLATLPLIEERPEALLEVTRAIIEPGREAKATDLFQAGYRLEALRTKARFELAGCTCLLTPTAGRLFKQTEIAAEPIARNTELGYYTNYMNLLDFCAVAVPAGFTRKNLPFGVTLVAERFNDRKLLSIAKRLEQYWNLPLGATGLPRVTADSQTVGERSEIPLLVCGAHMDGLALNWQLRERGAVFVARVQTAPCYRLYALADGIRPGLVYDTEQGCAIEAEIWSVPVTEFGSFVAAIPAPLGIGKVELEDGRELPGFICENRALEGASEISELGGWRNYLAAKEGK